MIAGKILNFWLNLLRKFKSFTLLSCGFRIFSWTAESAACFTQSVAASHSFSVVENDLHVLSHAVTIVTIVGNSLAEVVKGLDGGISMRVSSGEGLPVPFFEAGPAAFKVTEKLRQVLRLSVSDSPLEVLRLPCGSLLLLLVIGLRSFFSGSFSFSFNGSSRLLNFFLNWLLDHICG